MPLLALLLGVEQHQAPGVTLAVLLLPVGLPAVLAYRRLFPIRWGLVGGLVAGCLPGVASGAKIEVDIAPLDEILQGISPTYIKMDIEGAETEALQGAARIIRKALPILAISVYHRFDHLWRLPLLIQSMSRRYCFFLRSHGAEAFDLVCYAVPADRLRLLL